MPEYRAIPGHAGYLAGSDGSILGKRGKLLRQFPGIGGYLRFTTFEAGKWQQVSTHVMVCTAFHGRRPEGHYAAHRNGVRTDNRAENLRWLTANGNEADKLKHGRRMQGETHHRHKLTEDQVREIRANYTTPGSIYARRFRVTDSCVSSVRSRKTWRHI